MSESVEILFQLLRIALGSEEKCDLPSGIDWKEVVDLSFDQGVAAIAVEGLGFAHDNDGPLRPFDQLRAGEAQGKLSSPTSENEDWRVGCWKLCQTQFFS